MKYECASVEHKLYLLCTEILQLFSLQLDLDDAPPGSKPASPAGSQRGSRPGSSGELFFYETVLPSIRGASK